MEARSERLVKILVQFGAKPELCDRKRSKAPVYYAACDCIEAAKAWVELNWPANCKANAYITVYLPHRKFDILTVITSFVFKADSPIAKIAEFRAGIM